MRTFIDEICDILEVSEISMEVRLEDLPEWDSLNELSVIAVLESDYGIQMNSSELKRFSNLRELNEYVEAEKT